MDETIVAHRVCRKAMKLYSEARKVEIVKINEDSLLSFHCRILAHKGFQAAVPLLRVDTQHYFCPGYTHTQ